MSPVLLFYWRRPHFIHRYHFLLITGVPHTHPYCRCWGAWNSRTWRRRMPCLRPAAAIHTRPRRCSWGTQDLWSLPSPPSPPGDSKTKDKTMVVFFSRWTWSSNTHWISKFVSPRRKLNRQVLIMFIYTLESSWRISGHQPLSTGHSRGPGIRRSHSWHLCPPCTVRWAARSPDTGSINGCPRCH